MPTSAGKRGRPWSDHLRVIDAILYRYRTGIPWRDLPTEFGSWKTVWARHRRRAGEGWWDRILAVLLSQADAAGLSPLRIQQGVAVTR